VQRREFLGALCQTGALCAGSAGLALGGCLVDRSAATREIQWGQSRRFVLPGGATFLNADVPQLVQLNVPPQAGSRVFSVALQTNLEGQLAGAAGQSVFFVRWTVFVGLGNSRITYLRDALFTGPITNPVLLQFLLLEEIPARSLSISARFEYSSVFAGSLSQAAVVSAWVAPLYPLASDDLKSEGVYQW